jgi:hypothetical protein
MTDPVTGDSNPSEVVLYDSAAGPSGAKSTVQGHVSLDVNSQTVRVISTGEDGTSIRVSYPLHRVHEIRWGAK